MKRGEEFLTRFAKIIPTRSIIPDCARKYGPQLSFVGEKNNPVSPAPQPHLQFDLGRGCRLDVLWIASGQFYMSSVASEIGRDPNEEQKALTLEKGIGMGRHEITQEQWKAVMGNQPSFFRKAGKTAHVEWVFWQEALAFCQRLNDLLEHKGKLPAGLRFDLPIEAKWEYACRPGLSESLRETWKP